jgi:hypothetical protein
MGDFSATSINCGHFCRITDIDTCIGWDILSASDGIQTRPRFDSWQDH